MTETPVALTDLSRALESVLKDFPEAILVRLASDTKISLNGCRPGHPETMRMKLLYGLRTRLPDLSPEVARFLRNHFPEARLLSILKRSLIEERRRQLTAFFGKARFILALLADARDEVRDWGRTWMSEATGELPTPESAEETLSPLFSPVLRLAGNSPAASAKNREIIDGLRAQLAAADKEKKGLRRQAEAEARKQVDAMKTELATLNFSLGECRREIDRLQAQIRRDTELRDRRVAELLAEKQIRLFGSWLKPLVAVSETLQSAVPADVWKKRTDDALRAQAQFDRAAAEYAALEEREQEVSLQLRRIDGALAHAQRRHPAVLSLRAELAAEQARLREALHSSAAESPLVAELEHRINAAAENDGDAVRALLRTTVNLGLIGKDTEGRLRALFRKRVALWDLGTADDEKDAVSPDSESAIVRRNPELTAALRGQGEALIFLDGHNILNGLGRYKKRRGEVLGHEEARKRTEKDIKALFANLPMVCVHLVWDGRSMADRQLSDNVTVHYSGGIGEHRADNYVIASVRYYAQEVKTPVPMVVVTDDNGFGGEVSKLGAKVCKLHDFEAFLNEPAH